MSEVLSDSMLRLMSKEDRRSIGQQTSREAQESFVAKNEKALQNQIAGYLRLHGLWFDQDAMHKRRTGSAGTPDFVFPYRGKSGECFYVAWEVKTATGKLRDDQERARCMIEAQGGQWRLIRSLQECKEHLLAMDSTPPQPNTP